MPPARSKTTNESPTNRQLPTHIAAHWGKTLTYLLTLPWFPRTADRMLAFQAGGLLLCLALYHCMPNKAPSSPATSARDKAFIAANLALTYLFGKGVIAAAAASGHLLPVDSLREVPPVQLLYFLAWVVCEEVLFFFMHRFAHTRAVYKSPLYAHSMHHKFVTTSAWTSFYAHPCDHLLAVLGTALALPLAMMRWGGVDCSVPVLNAFMFGAIITFTGSHHCVMGAVKAGDLAGRGKAVGSDHLTHHQRFVVNYGNFGLLDYLAGSYAGEAFGALEEQEKTSSRR